jgi:hypothetical protein
MFIECLEDIVDTFKIPKIEKIPYYLLTIIYIDCPKCITTKHTPPPPIEFILLVIILLIVLKVL